MSSDDYSNTIEVEAEERRFICPLCNTGATYIIYPIAHPTDGAVPIVCHGCDHLFWWSRLQSKLYNNNTEEEVAPENILLLGKVIALQFRNTSEVANLCFQKK